jgi:glucokinase
MRAAAIDIGGTKLAVAIIDEAGDVLAVRKSPVVKGDVEATAAQIGRELDAVRREAGLEWNEIAAVGAIVPGIFVPSDGTAWAPNLWGRHYVPLRDALAAIVPSPLRIEADRSGYVLGERWMGAARGLDDVVFVAIGTGIGAGVIAGGHLIRGSAGVAGAVGWMALNPADPEPYRELGCWETEGAGPALALAAGEDSAEKVIERARMADPEALWLVDCISLWAAMGVSNLIAVLDPQMVVLGGGLMQAGDLFLDRIRERVPSWAPPAAAHVRIELSQLGDRAGLYGAAWLALNL